MKISKAVQFNSTGTRKTEEAKLSSLVLHTIFAQVRGNSKEIQWGQKMGNLRLKILFETNVLKTLHKSNYVK